MKALHLAGSLVAVSFLAVGLALGGAPGMLLAGACLGVALLLLVRTLRGPSPTSPREGAFLGKVVLAAFLLRAAVSLLLHATGWWEYLGQDEETFDFNGQIFAMYLAGDSPYPLNRRFLGSHEVGYFYLVGALYHAFGVSKFLPLLLNCVVGACTVYPVHALAGRWGGRLAARRAALLVAFFPSLVLWGALGVRDALVLFFLSSALLFVDGLRRRGMAASLGGLLLCMAALATLRTHIFILLGAASLAGLLLVHRRVGRSLLTGAALMLLLVVAMRGTGLGQSEFEKANLETIAEMRRVNALGPSVAGSLGSDVDISTPTAALTYLPEGLLYFYCSPLPWQIGSPRQVMALADLLVWYGTLPFVLAGMLWLVRRRFRGVLPTLLVVIGISVLYALVEGNIGIIFRHRAQVVVPLCVVAGVGHAVRRRAAARIQAMESRALEGPVPHHAAARGPLRPAPRV